MPPHAMDQGLPKPPLEIGSYFAGYRVLALIGQGGHACVFRVLDEFLDKCFALKVLYRAGGVTPEMMKRGRSEAQFLSSLRHPNVVEVVRAGIENGLLFIVMELLEGRSLRLVQHHAGRLEVEEVLTIAEHIAEGVGAAHQHQAIHRDLKPDNVFICTDNRSKVLDFGIAKLVGQGGWTTQRNIVPGTMLYMSPEQLQGMPLGPESDVYATGLIMFTLLFGRHPCLLDMESVSNDELARIQVMRVPPQLDQIAPHIPRYVARLVAKMLAKLPEERIRSMIEVAQTIRQLRERYIGEMRQAGRVLQMRDLSSCNLGGEFQVSLAGQRVDTATVTDSRIASPLPAVAGQFAQAGAIRTVEYASPASRRPGASSEPGAPTSADKPTMMAGPGQGGHSNSSPPAAASAGIPVRSVVFESRRLSRATPTPSPTSLGRTAPPNLESASPSVGGFLARLGPYRTPVVTAIYAGVGLGLGLAVLFAVRGGVGTPAAAGGRVVESAVAGASVAPPLPPAPIAEAAMPEVSPVEAPPTPAASAVVVPDEVVAAAPKPAAVATSVPAATQLLATRPAPAKSANVDPVLERMKATARHFHEEAEGAKKKPKPTLPFNDSPGSGL
jgi:serine/threonine protein kinase